MLDLFLRHQTRTVSRISFRNPGVGKSNPSRGPAAGGTPDGLRRCTRGQSHRGLQCVGRAVVTLGLWGCGVGPTEARICCLRCGAPARPYRRGILSSRGPGWRSVPSGGRTAATSARQAPHPAPAGVAQCARAAPSARPALGRRRRVAAHVEGARPFGALSQLHAVGTVSGQCSEAGPCR